MPTHSSLLCVEIPDGLAQDMLTSDSANVPGLGSSMTPHSSYSMKAMLHAGGSRPLPCMFCEETFSSQEELGPHLLTEHPTSLHEPAVLRVEAEFRIPGERSRPKAGGLPVDKEQLHSCIVCGQVSQDATELETHMRKHKDYFTYCCDLCGRRFREPWFLKNHMKMHSKQGAKSKAQQEHDAPFTLNGITQDPPPEVVVTRYKMCMVCGFLFPDHDALVEHSKVHNRGPELGKEGREALDDASSSQSSFLCSLGLRPCSTKTTCESSSTRIPQLDPFTTYQAWQLATKGKVAVSRNTTKCTGQEGSTDNEECSSDKDESGGSQAEGQADKAAREGVGMARQHAAVAPPKTPRSSLMHKVKDKDRPTTCEDCQRTFRTYHQLVLHSRVHKRDRGGEESPTPLDGKLPQGGLLDQSEDGSEEGSEEAGLAEGLSPGEDYDRSKIRSKECTYCGKSFRSSYYLTVHLRTHTGEKPYKCGYCDYAAAQKTSLKYHLDRRHKGKPCPETFSQAAPSGSPPSGSPPSGSPSSLEADGENLPPGEAEACATSALSGVPGGASDAQSEKLTVPAPTPPGDFAHRASPVNLKMEKVKEEEEQCDDPLNLSLKASLCVPAGPENATAPAACLFCAYKTIYPEVLIVHTRLAHKDKSDMARRNASGSGLKRRRLTGCPPALRGNDVAPLEAYERRHPRRTKSPPRQPATQQEQTVVGPPAPAPARAPAPAPAPPPPPPPPERSPRHPPLHNVGQDIKRPRHHQHAAIVPPPTQDSFRLAGAPLPRRFGSEGRNVAERPAPPAIAEERSHPAARGGARWHSDAARLCMPSHFGSLPQVDFGAPAGKRPKYMTAVAAPPGREADAGERAGFRGAFVGGASRQHMPGRAVKGPSQGSGLPSPLADSFGPLRVAPAAIGSGGLESEWNMMNLLRSYPPSDLASFYHSAPANPSHGGLGDPRTGGITVLYQHLPSLPNLQRRDPSGLFPNQRFGPTDKSH